MIKTTKFKEAGQKSSKNTQNDGKGQNGQNIDLQKLEMKNNQINRSTDGSQFFKFVLYELH